MGALAGAIAISLAVILSAIGALNGWTLLMGQVPMAAAHDSLFPPLFGRLSPRGVPAFGIIVSAVFARLYWFIASRRPTRLLEAFYVNRRPEHDGRGHTLRLLRVAGGLVAAYAAGGGRSPAIDSGRSHRIHLRGVHALGCGAQAVLFGLIMLVLGIPV